MSSPSFNQNPTDNHSDSLPDPLSQNPEYSSTEVDTRITGATEDSTTTVETALPSAETAPVHNSEKKKGKKKATEKKPAIKGSRAASTWISLIFGALLMILLIIFILQNPNNADMQFLWWAWSIPVGVGTLLAAVVGALIMAMVGAVRIMQLRKQIRTR